MNSARLSSRVNVIRKCTAFMNSNKVPFSQLTDRSVSDPNLVGGKLGIPGFCFLKQGRFLNCPASSNGARRRTAPGESVPKAEHQDVKRRSLWETNCKVWLQQQKRKVAWLFLKEKACLVHWNISGLKSGADCKFRLCLLSLGAYLHYTVMALWYIFNCHSSVKEVSKRYLFNYHGSSNGELQFVVWWQNSLPKDCKALPSRKFYVLHQTTIPKTP